MTPNILSSREIEGLLRVNRPSDFEKIERQPDDYYQKINEGNFRVGEEVFLLWTEQESVLSFEAIYGVIAAKGKEVHYWDRREKEIPEKDRTGYETECMKLFFDPQFITRNERSTVSGIYKPSSRLLIRGVGLTPVWTGFGEVPQTCRIPLLYDDQKQDQFLVDLNYLKEAHVDVALGRWDIEKTLKLNGRERYTGAVNGTIGDLVRENWRITGA